MPEIEVAGLLLRVLPILFSAVDFSKDGFCRAGAAIRKRKYVEKLVCALLLQQSIIQETVKSVLIASRHKDIYRLEDDSLEYLKAESVRDEVMDYLGPKNDAAFTGNLERCHDIAKRIAKNLADLVPTFKDASDDLLRIIKANTDAEGKRLDLIPRVKVIFGVNELKRAVQELDDTTAALDRFTRILLSNRRTVEDTSSKMAVKLAKALLRVRKCASNLSLAIFKGWKAGCHSQHEARLFPNDRVDTAAEILKQIGKDNHIPILVFQLLFAEGMSQGEIFWLEADFQVFNGDVDDNSNPSTDNNACGAIEAAKYNQGQNAFVLVGNQQIGTISTEKTKLIQHQRGNVMTLEYLLSADMSQRNGPILSLKFRMLFALPLALNLPQPIQTQWLEGAWSKGVVYPMLRPTGFGIGRPFVSLTFDDSTLNTKRSPSVQPKVVLLELGIFLLEIWQETGLGDRFSLEKAPTGYYQRLVLAVEWLEDADNPLLDRYDKPVSHCIQRAIGESHLADW